MKICFFAGSNGKYDDSEYVFLEELADFLIKKEANIFYGAGNTGLMGLISNKFVERGSKVIGIIPKSTKISEMVNHKISTIYQTQDLSSRKKLMTILADCFIIFPGGIGTIDELFEVLSLKQIDQNFKNKNIIIFNKNGYYTGLINFFQEMKNHGFIKTSDIEMFDVVESGDDLITLLKRIYE